MTDKSLIQRDLIKTDKKTIVEKTERVVTALYLVSSLIIDKEPLKWQIREQSLETLSLAHKGVHDRLLQHVDDLISLIALANRSALVSSMNAEMLDSAMRTLRQSVSQVEMFGQDFFAVSTSAPDSVQKDLSIKDKDVTENVREEVSFIKRQQPVAKKTLKRKDKRKELVLEALKKKQESSVKDIARHVRGCSEKTIQRELNSLIAEGSVEKKGERRWSTYSLA